MQDLNVTIVQADLKWENPAANFEHLGRLIESSLEPSDLIVLPETFNTGFTMNVSLAEKMDGPSMQWMAEVAQVTGAVVTGSLMVNDGGNIYNRLIWMRPNGTHDYYDKRHRFSLGGEAENYTPGSKRLITELNGWRICPNVCYDLRFPVWLRNQDDYDMLLLVANWPEKRAYAWKQLLIARAIENQSYVVGANRVGLDGIGINCVGDSMVVDPLGKVVFTEAEKEAITTIKLSAEYLAEVRQQLPFLNDRDRFELK